MGDFSFGDPKVIRKKKSTKYKMSNGEYIDKDVLDRKVLKTKEEYTDWIIQEYGHLFCERCGENEQGCPGIARSHIMSVGWCERSGQAELAFEITNLEHLGQKHHDEIEKWKNDKREFWFRFRANSGTYDDFLEAWEKENSTVDD